jgi:hypothetical protein
MDTAFLETVLPSDNKNQGIMNMSHFSLICEKKNELYQLYHFVHPVTKFAAIFGPK